MDITEKDFEIVEQNLKDYLKGDRNYLPSDGGIFEKIYESKNRDLQQKYQKKVGEILRPVIQEYFEKGKFKQQKVENCININEYLDMTKQDIYKKGLDFILPIANKIVYNGETYYRDSESLADIMGTFLERSLLPIIPEYYAPYGHYINCFIPPLPVEYIFILKQTFFDYYINILSPARILKSEEEIKKITTPNINDYDIVNKYLHDPYIRKS